MREHRDRHWRNWAGEVACRPQRLLQPETAEEAATIVRRAREAGRVVRPVGAGYSYVPLAQTDHDMVALDRLDGLQHVDLAAGRAVVGAGMRLGALARALARHGAALANLGDIDTQTVAGAIATGTHGTGRRLQSLSSDVLALTLVDGTGRIVTLDAGAPALMDAARLSLGALGLVLSVTLKIQPLYHLRVERSVGQLDRMLADLDRELADNRNFEFFWFPNDGLTYVKRMNETAPAAAGNRALRWFNDMAMENALVWLACRTTELRPSLRAGWLRLGRIAVPHDTSVLPAHRAYATPRLVRHHELEYALPLSRAAAALSELDRLLTRHPPTSMFPFEVRFTAADDLPLSPASGGEVVQISVHAYRTEARQPFFDRCEELFLAFGGRPHWGKLHSLQAGELAPRYPGWAAFHRARAELDPDQVFVNGYLRRLLGIT